MGIKKTLKILLVSGMMVSLGSLILPSRFWNKIVNAESTPPCTGAQLSALLDEARSAGNTGLAQEVQNFYTTHPNGQSRFTLGKGAGWLAYNNQGIFTIGIPQGAWGTAVTCPRPAANMSRPTYLISTPTPYAITQNATNFVWVRDREVFNENVTKSSASALTLRR